MQKNESQDQKEILDSLMSEMMNDFETCETPQYIISGSGPAWFLDPESCQMVKMNRGTEIVPVGDLSDEDDGEKILVRAPFRFLLIPQEEVQEIGWN